jgi:hypothetical protein
MIGRIRRVGFVLLASFILFGPSYAAFERDAPGHLPRWRMFGGIGLDIYEMRLEREIGGRRVAIERDERVTRRGSTPPGRLAIRRKESAWRLVRQLCRTDGGPIYMRLRDARRSGWKLLEDGTRDVCAVKAPPVERAGDETDTPDDDGP